MASGTAPDGDAVELISMWVAPHVRGCGVGDALIAAIVDWARRNGARRIALDVMSANDHALHLYERHGFRTVDASPANPKCERRMVRNLA
jgi:ribosomal protein S18 acetylase RimI-like enzyme